MAPDEKTVREAGMPYTLGLGGAPYGHGRVYGREGKGDGPPGSGTGAARKAGSGHTGHDTPGAGRARASATVKDGALIFAIRKAGKSIAVVEQVRCPLTKFYQWQMNVNRWSGPNPAADLKFFVGKQPSKKSRKRDLQWFRRDEAKLLLAACQAKLPRWYAFLRLCFGGGLRWGEATALERSDLDWTRGRVHVQRTWSEDGGRV